MKIYVEPRDVWVGYFRGPTHHYMCPLPCIVIRWPRRWPERTKAQELQDLLGDISLYIPWIYVTKQLTTRQKDLFADAVDQWRPDPADPSPGDSRADRWWRADAPIAARHRA